MIAKHLTIAAAFVLLTGFGVGPVLAQNTGGATAPAATTAAPATPAPADAGPTVIKAPTAATASTENPYGLGDIIKKKNPVSYTVLGILLVMSIGTWYIFFTKYLDQSRILNQARIVERRFWTAGSINEGIDRLPKNSMFRAIAEGVRGRHHARQPQRLDCDVAVAPA
jgi:biopolymer transport protein ExbB